MEELKDGYNCPLCGKILGGKLTKGYKTETIKYEGERLELANLTYFKCDMCKEDFVDQKTMQEHNAKIETFACMVNVREVMYESKDEKIDFIHKQLQEKWGREIKWQIFIGLKLPKLEMHIARLKEGEDELYIALEVVDQIVTNWFCNTHFKCLMNDIHKEREDKGETVSWI